MSLLLLVPPVLSAARTGERMARSGSFDALVRQRGVAGPSIMLPARWENGVQPVLERGPQPCPPGEYQPGGDSSKLASEISAPVFVADDLRRDLWYYDRNRSVLTRFHVVSPVQFFDPTRVRLPDEVGLDMLTGRRRTFIKYRTEPFLRA